MIALKQQSSPLVTRPLTQQEWRNSMPPTSSPTTAYPRKLSPIETPVLPPTSHERCAICSELSRTSHQPTILKPMVKAREQTSPSNSICAYTVGHTRKTGQHGCR